jgi:nitroimidazol reductase NimA-like FMN-containing flavoprotein (pyridoxamine 5'-phosphate oxidase superfamily)
MNRNEPVGELHAGFSAEDATATPWAEARSHLEDADIAWLTTVRPDGRPHVTPVMFVWMDDAAYFTTGPNERKAANLARNSHCILTTGCNVIDAGLDIVVEGEAAPVGDPERRRQVADGFATKYLPREGAKIFHADIRDGSFLGEGSSNVLYEVKPSAVFGFGKGAFSQTRWLL